MWGYGKRASAKGLRQDLYRRGSRSWMWRWDMWGEVARQAEARPCIRSFGYIPPEAGIWITLPTWVGCSESMESEQPIRRPWEAQSEGAGVEQVPPSVFAGTSEVLWAMSELHYCMRSTQSLVNANAALTVWSHHRCRLTACQMAAQLVTPATGFGPIKWAKRVVNKE